MAGRVLYVQGAECAWLHQPYKALVALKDATRFLKQANSDDLYTGMAFSKLGQTYEMDGLYDIAHLNYLNALPVFLKYRHDFYLACVYRDLGRTMHDSTGSNLDSIYTYYNLSRQHALMVGNDALIDEIDIFTYPILNSDINKRNQLILKMADKGNYRHMDKMVEYFLPTHIDSARFYLNLLANDTTYNNYNKNLYYHYLSQILYASGKMDSAYCVLNNAYNYYHQQNLDNAHQKMYAISQQYDVEYLRKEALRKETIQQHATIVILLLITGMAISLCFLSIILARRKKEYLIKQQKEHEHLQKIEYLQKDIEMKRSYLKQRLTQQINFQKQLNQLSMADIDTDTLLAARLKESKLLYENPDEIKKQFTLINPDFFNILTKKYPELTDFEQLLIALFGIGFNNQDICILLNKDKRTVWNRRNRIRQHVGIDSDTDLDRWILETVTQLTCRPEQ